MTLDLALTTSRQLDGARSVFDSGHGMCAQVRRPWSYTTTSAIKRTARHLGDVST